MLEQLGGDETALEHYFWYQMLTWDQMSDMSQRSDLHLQLQNLYYGEGSGVPHRRGGALFAQDELGIYRAKHILLTVDPRPGSPWTRRPSPRRRPRPTTCSPSCAPRRTRWPCSTS